MTTIRNLGKAIGIIIRADTVESFMHADVRAWGAPSECHTDVSRGEAARRREARRHAEAVAGAPLRVIAKQARRRGGFQFAGPRYDRAFGRIYAQRGYPF